MHAAVMVTKFHVTFIMHDRNYYRSAESWVAHVCFKFQKFPVMNCCLSLFSCRLQSLDFKLMSLATFYGTKLNSYFPVWNFSYYTRIFWCWNNSVICFISKLTVKCFSPWYLVSPEASPRSDRQLPVICTATGSRYLCLSAAWDILSRWEESRLFDR